ncbi:MAG TPA: WhiB family transcriptional regulator [Acidimicrobiales bacterium]|nr:WhiB family transcriptional regulator [Acidimicrobiales bacterium]
MARPTRPTKAPADAGRNRRPTDPSTRQLMRVVDAGAPALRLVGAPDAADGTWRDRGDETVGAALPFKAGFADWTALARCRGMDVTRFFSTDPEILADAKLICRECEVRLSCLDEALRDAGIRGVWGGTSEDDRRAVRRRRAQS